MREPESSQLLPRLAPSSGHLGHSGIAVHTLSPRYSQHTGDGTALGCTSPGDNLGRQLTRYIITESSVGCLCHGGTKGSVAGVSKQRRVEARIIPGPQLRYSQSLGQRRVPLTPSRPNCHRPPNPHPAPTLLWVPYLPPCLPPLTPT